MTRTILPAIALVFLAACSGSKEPPPVAVGQEHIDCAVSGSAELKPACSVERVQVDDKLMLVVHHPDGAFRRFDVTTDGSGLALADGADTARTRLVDGRLEVVVGPDRYVFPATEKPDAAR